MKRYENSTNEVINMFGNPSIIDVIKITDKEKLLKAYKSMDHFPLIIYTLCIIERIFSEEFYETFYDSEKINSYIETMNDSKNPETMKKIIVFKCCLENKSYQDFLKKNIPLYVKSIMRKIMKYLPLKKFFQ